MSNQSNAPGSRQAVWGFSAAALVVLLASVAALATQSCGGSASDKTPSPPDAPPVTTTPPDAPPPVASVPATTPPVATPPPLAPPVT